MEKTWNILNITYKTEDGGLSQVITKVRWKYDISKTINGQVFSSGTFGDCVLSEPTNEEFIPYSQITKETVIGWVQELLGEDQILQFEDLINLKIDQQAAPSTITVINPFN